MNGLKARIHVFNVKSVLIPPKNDAPMILEQDLMKRYWILGV